LVDVFSALLTPVIALTAVYIAYQQYKINKLRLRHELYERRLHVYKAVQSFLSEILIKGDVEFARCTQFYADASEATFLFDKYVQKFIDEIYKKAINMHALQERMYPPDGSPGLPVGGERTKVAKESEELLKWLTDKLPASKDLFHKQMGIK
jgi:hypothetical protein